MTSSRFKPGQTGNPSGRPRKLLKRPDEILHELGVSPVAEILALIPELRTSDQLKAWLELLTYCHAKPKEISVDVTNTPLALLSDDELLKLVRGGTKPKELESA